MKTNGTQTFFLRSILLLILSFTTSISVFCQPDYDFRKSVLVSGTNNQKGAIYLFKKVKTGVDAAVTIKDINGGASLVNIDGGSGYAEALQPIIDLAPNSTGYIEFEINFLVTGTNTPMIQTELPITPIDIDGQTYPDGTVNEFDVLQLTNGYVDFDMLGKNLRMNINAPWVKGTNTTSSSLNGIDTLHKQAMFTVTNAGLSKFTFRTGANNTSSAVQQRLRSLYFKKFFYPNSFLAVSALNQFKGYTKNNKVQLQWNILSNNLLQSVIIEKAYNPSAFTSIGEVWMNTEAVNNSNSNYNFNDNASLQGTVYYRLKMIDAKGTVQYSGILVFRSDDNKTKSFKMYPSVINDNATVNITSDKSEQTFLQVVDLSGRIVYQKQISLLQGQNNVAINGFSGIRQGTYVAVVKAGNSTYSQKIIIQ